MIPATALRMARDHAPAGAHVVFAGRPHGVAHLYSGPLTPAGNVPGRCRPVCGAHTRRLATFGPPTNVLAAPGRRVCLRCTRILTMRASRCTSPAPRPLRSREALLAAHATTTTADLEAALLMAETLAEVDQTAHLAVLLFATGQTDLLNQAVTLARRRLGAYAADDAKRAELDAVNRAAAMSRRKADRHEVHVARERRIYEVGFDRAVPTPRRRTA
ncbi:MAG: hypothetical protein JWO46_2444 [Nocardioidaceae bacterium]|nr:hypothetical protein [Nocardioidaceae bacterium]